MNRTNFEHLFIALAIQALAGFILHDWIIGAVFASGIFLGREHAQREYHIGDPSKLVGYEALDFWNWSRDGLLDLLAPVVGVACVAILVSNKGNL